MITFGTDGWRAVISEDFTFENVRRVAQAIAEGFSARVGSKRLAVGYDTRFLSDRYAELVTEVLLGNGFAVLLCDRPTPTPALSYTIKRLGLAGGVMITASHNAARFNGIKVKTAAGSPAPPDVTAAIERAIGQTMVRLKSLTAGRHDGSLDVQDVSEPYLAFLRQYLDFRALQTARLRVLVDAMHGCGDGYVARLLEGTSCQVRVLRAERDPLFGGMNPEPIAKNLAALRETIQQPPGYDIGLATDGDADRVGIVRPDGDVVGAGELLALLLVHLVEGRGWRGAVVKTTPATQLVDRIARQYELPVLETPVGFKHIAALMAEQDVLIGGEESGGYGFKQYVPERDGILAGLLCCELLAMRGQGLQAIMEDVFARFGRFYYLREDLEYPNELKARLVPHLRAHPPGDLAGDPVASVSDQDGIKFVSNRHSWLLLRLSGTEPVLRIYAEAEDAGKVRALIAQGKAMAFQV